MNRIELILTSFGVTVLLYTTMYTFSSTEVRFKDKRKRKQRLKICFAGLVIALGFFITSAIFIYLAKKSESKFKANPAGYSAFINGIEVRPESIDLDNYLYQFNEDKKEVYLMPKGLGSVDSSEEYP